MPGMKYDDDDEVTAMMKKYTKVYGELGDDDKAKLKEHSKMHTPEHMQMMMDLMRKGMSFDEAHDLAQKKYPSPKKEMKGMMQYDEKKAAFYMKKSAKPDFLDMDKDGDRKEPMSKALKDKEKAKASIEYVFMETSIQEVVAVVQASGETKLKISGIAFHEGFNKNKWSITRAGVENVVKQMIGADLTLNHPPTKEKGVGFVRNMDGGVNDAVVGIVTEAKVVDVEGGYEVHYTAEVLRSELFPALESGLWTRGEYGVSIGGWGIPISTAEDGGMVFEADFKFDHLAIVHKPAYERASIDTVEKVKAEDEFIYQTEDTTDNGDTMTEEIEQMATELEELRSQLILANATIDDYNAREAAAAEEARLALVQKASELGLNGHDDLSSETLESLIASWEASRPEPVVMAEATPAADESVEASEPVVASDSPKKVVANYLNGSMVETDAEIYGRVWNSIARAYNSNFSSDGGKAYTFDEAMEKGFINTQ